MKLRKELEETLPRAATESETAWFGNNVASTAVDDLDRQEPPEILVLDRQVPDQR